MSSNASASEVPGLFPRTQWSLVLAATQPPSPQAAIALETICRAYWPPLYAYARRCGQSPPDAQDLTQEFFAELLEKRWLASADREKGKLRTFLIVAMKRFMGKAWRKASAQRRGNGHMPVPLDPQFAETFASSAADKLAPEQVFDQQWALTLLELTLKRLEEEFASASKSTEFRALKECLMAAHGAIDYAAVAAQLGTNPSTARVAVHRLRKRFRELYREEISHTLAPDADLDAEVRYLAAALAQAESETIP